MLNILPLRFITCFCYILFYDIVLTIDTFSDAPWVFTKQIIQDLC